MYKLMESRKVEVAPDHAKHYLTFNTYHSQRDVRPGHVQELLDKMLEDKFHEGRIVFGRFNGVDVMLDGQHVSHAIVQFGSSVVCNVMRFICESENDLADLFCQMEILNRSTGDMVKAKHNAMHLKWPLWISRLTVSAATLEVLHGEKWRFRTIGRSAAVTTGSVNSAPRGKTKISHDDQMKLLEKYYNDAMFLTSLFSNGENSQVNRPKHVTKAPVAMMIFKTRRVSEDDARVFWSGVAFGEILTRDEPIYLVREFLWNSQSGKERHISPTEICARIARGWNAFRRNESTRLAWSPRQPIPELV